MNELWDRLMFAQSQPATSADEQQRIMQSLQVQPKPSPSYINGQYASTPDEMAEDVRHHGTVRTDMSTLAQKQFIQNLPPDIELIPDPAGYMLLRLRNVPMS